jgi:isopentenyl phosphate kinase
LPDTRLTFLKLGGSLITDKNLPETVRHAALSDCLVQVKRWLTENPSSKLVLGHGSGSFGHFAAKTYRTRDGVFNEQDWLGYAKVWHSARKLNNVFIDACVKFGIPVVDFPISASVLTKNRAVETWNLEPLAETLKQGLVPVVHGDVCIDSSLGGTILSTEEIFQHLSSHLQPTRILLAGIEQGVYADYPTNQHLIPLILANSDFSSYLQGSGAKDVTGGMATKVVLMQAISQFSPGLEIRIFSGLEPTVVYKTLSGETMGTCIV